MRILISLFISFSVSFSTILTTDSVDSLNARYVIDSPTLLTKTVSGFTWQNTSSNKLTIPLLENVTGFEITWSLNVPYGAFGYLYVKGSNGVTYLSLVDNSKTGYPTLTVDGNVIYSNHDQEIVDRKDVFNFSGTFPSSMTIDMYYLSGYPITQVYIKSVKLLYSNCFDNGPVLELPNNLYTCDRTCESVDMVTDQYGQCLQTYTGETCQDIETTCYNYCGDKGVFAFDCSQNMIDGVAIESVTIDTPCTCNAGTQQDDPDTIQSALDIKQTEQHLTSDNGDVYNTYTYEKNMTTITDFSAIIAKNAEIVEQLQNIDNTLQSSSSTTSSDTNVSIDMTETNSLLTDIKNLMSDDNTSSDINKIDENGTSSDLLSTYTDFYNNMTSQFTILNDKLDNSYNEVNSSNFAFDMSYYENETFSNCPYSVSFNMGVGVAPKPITFDICSALYDYKDILYKIWYVLFVFGLIKIGLIFIRL